jgi:hypothetical protein
MTVTSASAAFAMLNRTSASGSSSKIADQSQFSLLLGQLSRSSTVADDSAPDMPDSDTLEVDLPNGFSVRATHTGGGSSGFTAQLLNSLEDIVGYLSKIDTVAGEKPLTQAPGGAPGAVTIQDGKAMQYRSLDTFHINLSDGYSIDLHHTGSDPDGENNPTAMNAMIKAMETLIGTFGGAKDTQTAVDPSLLFNSSKGSV